MKEGKEFFDFVREIANRVSRWPECKTPTDPEARYVREFLPGGRDYKTECDILESELDYTFNRLEGYEEALEFYADEENWRVNDSPVCDNGARARAALERWKGKSGG